MLEDGDVPALRDNLSRFPQYSVNLSLSNRICARRFDVLMAAWPKQDQDSPLLLLGNAPVTDADPDVLASVFSHPSIQRIELIGVPIDEAAFQAIAGAIARDGTRLRELTYRHIKDWMFEPRLAELLALLTELDGLNLHLIPSPLNQIPTESACQPLMMALLQKPLQELCLINFAAYLWFMLPPLGASPLPPRWQAVSLECHNLGLNSQNEVAAWSFNGFANFVRYIIGTSSASALSLKHISCNTRLPLLEDGTQAPDGICFINLRNALQSALEDRSLQPGAVPLSIAVEMTDLDVLRVLLPAFAAPSVRGLESLELHLTQPPFAPAEEESGQVHAHEFLKIVTEHADHLQHTDNLCLGLDLPGSATHLDAQDSINALAQALDGLRLTALDFSGAWFEELPAALQNCMHAAAARAVHMNLQRQALGSCIRFGGSAYAQLGEVGSQMLEHLEHTDRLLPVVPALDSAHLKAFVDCYESRRTQSTRAAQPGPHPLKAVSDSVQKRLNGGGS